MRAYSVIGNDPSPAAPVSVTAARAALPGHRNVAARSSPPPAAAPAERNARRDSTERSSIGIRGHGAHLKPGGSRRYAGLRRGCGRSSRSGRDSGHCGIDIRIPGSRGMGKQRGGRHDLPSLTIPALRDIRRQPSCLHFSSDLARADALDGGDARVADALERQHAGAHRGAVRMHGAGAAQTHAAAVLGPGEVQDVAQDPEKRRVALRIHRVLRPVDLDRVAHGTLSDACL